MNLLGDSIKSILVPSHGHLEREICVNAYNQFSKTLRNRLLSSECINKKKSPAAACKCLEHMLTKDGFVILSSIIEHNSPQLGGDAIDPEVLVSNFDLKDNESVLDFYVRALNIRHQLELQQAPIPPKNKLLR